MYTREGVPALQVTPGTDAWGRGSAICPTFDSGSVLSTSSCFEWLGRRSPLGISGTKQKRVCVQAIFVHAQLVRSTALEKPPAWHSGAKNSWIISFRSVKGSWLRVTRSGGAQMHYTISPASLFFRKRKFSWEILEILIIKYLKWLWSIIATKQ